MTVDRSRIRQAYNRIAPHLRRTPLLTLHEHSTDGRTLVVKLESLQRTGSFKARGALNYALTHQKTVQQSGMVAASAGNHALGVLLASRIVEVDATIFLPESAGKQKVNRLTDQAGPGQTIHRVGREFPEAEQAARQHAEQTGASLVHPFDDPDVRSGQGTVAYEIEQQAPVDFIVFPVGGGGLAAGVAGYVREGDNPPQLFGAQDATNATLPASLRARKPIKCNPRTTLADGLATGQIAPDNLQVLLDADVQPLLVNEEAIRTTMAFIEQETNTSIEGAGAVSLAAALTHTDRLPDGRRVCIISGGNA